MKKISTLLFLVFLSYWMGCVAKKNTATAPVETVKTAKTTPKAKVPAPKTAVPESVTAVERVPNVVEEAFKVSYPLVEYPAWNIEKTGQEPQARLYHALFKINDKKQTVSYNKDAKVVETKAEIMPEQLPPLLYRAIMAKYPQATIQTSYTYKNILKRGAYLSNIVPYLGAKDMQIILTDEGEFVND